MQHTDLLFYHGSISRQRCEEIMAAKGKNGSYLIRESETIHGALCLCVYKKKIVYTYRILQTHTGYYTLQTSTGVQQRFFKTLEELVHHYQMRNQGLVTHLRRAVKRKPIDQENTVPDEEPDYENVSSSDYVDVLPE
ncbi:SH2 domain-containing protein 1B [Neoarius graeffei]|uniref:SH2 domain-containing protein 1B n=1 Tax=Neoarius graeffei TaxID=443677 RepID=UPI00298C4F57|nr:SH2 domain-containing protein 1B [Neoarius graeffei]